MIHKDADARRKVIESCHGGQGRLDCIERLADYRRVGPGIKFCHEDVLAPGASIGIHPHQGDEELYLILEGNGLMQVDSQTAPVGPGDLIMTRSGQSHGLENTGPGPLRLLVVCANVTPEPNTPSP